MNYSDQFEHVRENIRKAKENSPYQQEVKLVCVTKNHAPSIVQSVLDNGEHCIGENRVQEFLTKYNAYKDHPDKLEYHLIGSLQSNKVKYIIDKVDLIHSLDRLSLAKEINKRAKAIDRKMSCLIQVNVSKEDTKSGLYVDEVEAFVEKCLEYPNISIQGLMTMAPHTDDTDYIRKIFRELSKLREKISKKGYNELDMKYLSMGMTNDYTIAIEEGANIVRVGRSLFGQRDYSKRYY